MSRLVARDEEPRTPLQAIVLADSFTQVRLAALCCSQLTAAALVKV